MLFALLLSLGQVDDSTGAFSAHNPPASELTRALRAERVLRAGGRSGPGFAFFEFAPASGAGMGAACACTNPTGAKGETMTFTRASSGTCTKGSTISGIANGDLVTCAADQARVMPGGDGSGGLGLLVELAHTNSLVRFIEYADVAWADVGTPTLTGGQASPHSGAYASSAVQFDDNDGAGYEGRSQSVTVAAATAYWMHCYVKAGTLSSARITLDGTAATISGLSSSTWSVIEVGDASSSGVSIVAQVLNGAATTDTGTVVWGGCQVEAGGYRSSIIPTAGVAATKAVDQAIFNGPFFDPSSAGSMAATEVIVPAGTYTNPRDGVLNLTSVLNASGVVVFWSGGSLNAFSGAIAATIVASAVVSPRVGAFWSGGTSFNVYWNGSSVAGTAASAPAATSTKLQLGDYNGSHAADTVLKSVCLDPSPSRCR